MIRSSSSAACWAEAEAVCGFVRTCPSVYSPRLFVPCVSLIFLNSSRTFGTMLATLSVMDWLDTQRENWTIQEAGSECDSASVIRTEIR